jgi:hypothetical protein
MRDDARAVSGGNKKAVDRNMFGEKKSAVP